MVDLKPAKVSSSGHSPEVEDLKCPGQGDSGQSDCGPIFRSARNRRFE
jgi:hypothetical protein